MLAVPRREICELRVSLVKTRRDWARGTRGWLIWGIPRAILLSSPLMPARNLGVVWPVVLAFMGAACLVNARRCSRIHCFATGPFFLVMAALALLYGAGVLPFGVHGWWALSVPLLVGSVALNFIPEWALGRYRSSSEKHLAGQGVDDRGQGHED